HVGTGSGLVRHDDPVLADDEALLAEPRNDVDLVDVPHAVRHDVERVDRQIKVARLFGDDLAVIGDRLLTRERAGVDDDFGAVDLGAEGWHSGLVGQIRSTSACKTLPARRLQCPAPPGPSGAGTYGRSSTGGDGFLTFWARRFSISTNTEKAIAE